MCTILDCMHREAPKLPKYSNSDYCARHSSHVQKQGMVSGGLHMKKKLCSAIMTSSSKQNGEGGCQASPAIGFPCRAGTAYCRLCRHGQAQSTQRPRGPSAWCPGAQAERAAACHAQTQRVRPQLQRRTQMRSPLRPWKRPLRVPDAATVL